MSDFKTKLIDTVAEVLMNKHGMDKYNTTAVEWDRTNPDSQFAMCLEDAEIAVNTVLDVITNADEDEELEEEEHEPKHAVRRPTNVTSSAALFIFMQSEPGQPVYVEDVREWLAAVDEAGIPNGVEIEGHLHLSYDLRGEGIHMEKIECLECGYKDTLISEHNHD